MTGDAIAQADYIVVGAGSAGCALAARLGEAGRRVLVVEHGGADWGPFIAMPAALSYPMNMRRYDWGFSTEPEPHLGGRRLACPRGKVVGGSSSINGMVWVRGHPRDFDAWAAMGADGWSGADVAPYFERLEDAADETDAAWRGRGGPVHVTRGARTNPLHDAFVQAGAAAGFELTPDYNGEKPEGFGPMERTVWRGRRWSAADAYLKPALRRGTVALTRALARRVVIEDGRAVGVEVERAGRIEILRAGAEVILSASAINSPKLLMLSGIGPADHLQAMGAPVIADRPGVGANLQDHLEVYVQQECRAPVTLNGHFGLLAKARIAAEWLFLRRGHGASNHFESAGFVRSAPGVDYPDIQFHFLPAAVRYDGRAAARGHGFQAHVGPMRSKSRGAIRLKGPDPAQAPSIRFNYMSDPQDWADFRHCVRLTREIFAQGPFAPFRGAEIAPGAAVQSDDALDDWLRAHIESAYHPCGTCRIGRRSDLMAVVDPELKVIGVEGLRVADSSVFPRITNGNLNAPSIMTGEKAADLVLGRPAPAPSNRRPWVNPRWRESDR
jgi:choline dehydrogenase